MIDKEQSKAQKNVNHDIDQKQTGDTPSQPPSRHHMFELHAPELEMRLQVAPDQTPWIPTRNQSIQITTLKKWSKKKIDFTWNSSAGVTLVKVIGCSQEGVGSFTKIQGH